MFMIGYMYQTNIITIHFFLLQDELKMYVPFTRTISVSSNCGCDSCYCRELKCVDEKGMP